MVVQGRRRKEKVCLGSIGNASSQDIWWYSKQNNENNEDRGLDHDDGKPGNCQNPKENDWQPTDAKPNESEDLWNRARIIHRYRHHLLDFRCQNIGHTRREQRGTGKENHEVQKFGQWFRVLQNDYSWRDILLLHGMECDWLNLLNYF